MPNPSHFNTAPSLPTGKIAHYALAKPTKESLYASMPTDVQYRAKPLLDTLINRCGCAPLLLSAMRYYRHSYRHRPRLLSHPQRTRLLESRPCSQLCSAPVTLRCA